MTLFEALETAADKERIARESRLLDASETYWTAAARSLDGDAPTAGDVDRLRQALGVLGRTTRDLRSHVELLRRLRDTRQRFDIARAEQHRADVLKAATAATAEVARMRAEADRLETDSRIAVSAARDAVEECRRENLTADGLADALRAAGATAAHEPLLAEPPSAAPMRKFRCVQSGTWHGGRQLAAGDTIEARQAFPGVVECEARHVALRPLTLGGRALAVGDCIDWPASEAPSGLAELPAFLGAYSSEAIRAWAQSQAEGVAP